MNVVYVSPRYPPHTGGVERHVDELATRMAARGHDVVVHTADRGDVVDGRRLPQREVRDGVAIRRHWGVAPGGAFHLTPGVVPAVLRSTADVLHVHNYHSFPLPLATLAATVDTDAAVVATPHYHAGSASAVRDRLLTLYEPLGGWALRHADAVIAVSEWERQHLREDFGVAARVIPNGVDIERFAGVTPVVRDRPYLLTVGRLEAYKGVQHVIRALSELPEYDLLVAGDGPYADALENVASEAGVRDRVDFLGYVTDDDLPGLYAGAAAYVTMSTFEAYGMTVAEALAAGTPCVVRRAGALVDWTGRADCVSATVGTVVRCVREAVELSAPSEPLATWDDVASRACRVYEELVMG